MIASETGAVERLSYGRLAGLLGLAALIVSAVGVYPTVRGHGAAGLAAAGAALGVTVPVFLLAGWAVRRAARRGGALLAGRVLGGAGFVRLIVVAAAGAALEQLLTPPSMTFWLWVIGLYVFMALAEAWWAGKAFSSAPAEAKRRNAPP